MALAEKGDRSKSSLSYDPVRGARGQVIPNFPISTRKPDVLAPGVTLGFIVWVTHRMYHGSSVGMSVPIWAREAPG
jgi:hypothetical protein